VNDLAELIIRFETLMEALSEPGSAKQRKAIRREARNAIRQTEQFVRDAQKKLREMHVRLGVAPLYVNGCASRKSVANGYADNNIKLGVLYFLSSCDEARARATEMRSQNGALMVRAEKIRIRA
jgi:hypothetical protein